MENRMDYEQPEVCNWCGAVDSHRPECPAYSFILDTDRVIYRNISENEYQQLKDRIHILEEFLRHIISKWDHMSYASDEYESGCYDTYHIIADMCQDILG